MADEWNLDEIEIDTGDIGLVTLQPVMAKSPAVQRSFAGMERCCPQCGNPLPYRAKYCSNACKQRAYRQRKNPSVTRNVTSVMNGDIQAKLETLQRQNEAMQRQLDQLIALAANGGIHRGDMPASQPTKPVTSRRDDSDLLGDLLGAIEVRKDETANDQSAGNSINCLFALQSGTGAWAAASQPRPKAGARA